MTNGVGLADSFIPSYDVNETEKTTVSTKGDESSGSERENADDYERSKTPFKTLAAGFRKDQTWEELYERDQRRLAILKKVEDPFLRVLMAWRGTCWHGIMVDSMIWIPFVIFVAIRFLAHSHYAAEIPQTLIDTMGNGNISILGGFLSFFLVLFVNQTNTRFFDMYQLSRACSGRVQDIAGYASARLPPAEAHRLVRFMNAAHLAGYTGLGEEYTKRNFFDHFNDLYGLLQPEELQKFDGIDMDSGSDIFKELCTWCQKEVASAQRSGLLDDMAANYMQDQILRLRQHMDGIYDTLFQPPHFYYIHFLCVLTGIYLPLFAIDAGFSAGFGEDSHMSVEILYACIVIMQSIFGTYCTLLYFTV